MDKLKKVVIACSILVFVLCVYSFTLGNKVFNGQFENDGISWYILAKGFYCSLSLYLFYKIIEVLSKK
jgi:hypothetical protein